MSNSSSISSRITTPIPDLEQQQQLSTTNSFLNNTTTIFRRTRELTISSLASSFNTNIKDEGGEIRIIPVELEDISSNTLAEKSNTSSSSNRQEEEEEEFDQLTKFERDLISKVNNLLPNLINKSPLLIKVFNYLQGPIPAITETKIKPFLPKIENFFDKLFLPITRRRTLTSSIFLILWFFAFSFLVRTSAFTAKTSLGSPTFITGDSSFWSKNSGCGLNGTMCTPFTNTTLVFRCPGQTLALQLLNPNPVGPLLLNFQSLVVGGMDSQSTYRADSWICPAAIQQGLFGNQKGGCGVLEQVGMFQKYLGGSKNGVDSVEFNSTFPSSYRFLDGIKQSNCKDLRDEILAFNVVMTTLFSFVIRPKPAVFFWVLFIVGFWHVVLVSDPTSSPPNVSLGFKYFLPSLFVAYTFWRFSWRWVVPAFENAILERTIWYLAGYWIGVLINISLAWIPITQLTPSAIAKRPGSLIAVIVLAVVLLLIILNQIRVIRKTGWLFYYTKWYLIGTFVIALLIAVPGQEFRMHHYIAGILLLPGCAFVTRPSALFQGFLLGIFLDGVGRWGFESILQTSASLIGDGVLGSSIPTFITDSTNFLIDQSRIYWAGIPDEIVGQWDGFGLIVDDVLVYTGLADGLNYSISALDRNLPHYFRLSYQLTGFAGDFTTAATAFINEGTWIDPVAGST